MMVLSCIRQSNLARPFVWLTTAWLLLVITEIDRFHNHNDLVRCDLCLDVACHDVSSIGNGQSLGSWLLDAYELDDQATDCAACHLWTVLSSSDFISPQPVRHDDHISRFISAEAIGGPVAALLICCGRSPPDFS